MSTQLELEPDPLSGKRFLGLLLLSIAIVLTISQVTTKRIETRTPQLALQLRPLESKVEASSIQEVIPSLAPEKPSEPPQEPVVAEVAQTPPPAPEPAPEPPKPVGKPKPVQQAVPEPTITGSKLDWLSASEISRRDWSYADWLITRESSWRPNAQNPNSSAYGLKQFLDTTWAGVGCTKAEAINNPIYQLNCGDKYVKNRYGTWANAVEFWRANHYY